MPLASGVPGCTARAGVTTVCVGACVDPRITLTCLLAPPSPSSVRSIMPLVTNVGAVDVRTVGPRAAVALEGSSCSRLVSISRTVAWPLGLVCLIHKESLH